MCSDANILVFRVANQSAEEVLDRISGISLGTWKEQKIGCCPSNQTTADELPRLKRSFQCDPFVLIRRKYLLRTGNKGESE